MQVGIILAFHLSTGGRFTFRAGYDRSVFSCDAKTNPTLRVSYVEVAQLPVEIVAYRKLAYLILIFPHLVVSFVLGCYIQIFRK